jgi:hypothetical protein
VAAVFSRRPPRGWCTSGTATKTNPEARPGASVNPRAMPWSNRPRHRRKRAEAAGGEGKRELPRAHSGEAAAQAKQQGVGHRGGEWEGVVLEREAAMAEQQMLAAAAEGRPRPLPYLQVPQPEDVYDQRLEQL